LTTLQLWRTSIEISGIKAVTSERPPRNVAAVLELADRRGEERMLFLGRERGRAFGLFGANIGI
jgi:hypothetical protein